MPGSMYSRCDHYDEHRTSCDPQTEPGAMSFHVCKKLIRSANVM